MPMCWTSKNQFHKLLKDPATTLILPLPEEPLHETETPNGVAQTELKCMKRTAKKE